jgi:hypothetical protein
VFAASIIRAINKPRAHKWSKEFHFLSFQSYLIVQVSDPGKSIGLAIVLYSLNSPFRDMLFQKFQYNNSTYFTETDLFFSRSGFQLLARYSNSFSLFNYTVVCSNL